MAHTSKKETLTRREIEAAKEKRRRLEVIASQVELYVLPAILKALAAGGLNFSKGNKADFQLLRRHIEIEFNVPMSLTKTDNEAKKRSEFFSSLDRASSNRNVFLTILQLFDPGKQLVAIESVDYWSEFRGTAGSTYRTKFKLLIQEEIYTFLFFLANDFDWKTNLQGGFATLSDQEIAAKWHEYLQLSPEKRKNKTVSRRGSVYKGESSPE